MGAREHDSLAALGENGFWVTEGVLSPGELARYREALYRVAAFEREAGWARQYAYDRGANANQRVWNLISRDALFCRLVEHELVLAVLRAVIGWPALLSGSSANIACRHGAEEVVHADQTYMPEPWDRPHGLNIVWPIDDFTAENGATRVAPGSHLLNRAFRQGEDRAELFEETPCAAKAPQWSEPGGLHRGLDVATASRATHDVHRQSHDKHAGAAPEHDVAVLTAERQVDVAGVALTLVVLGHERDRLAVLCGDLLGGGLVDAVVVGGHQRVGIEEPDLVLPEVALALGAPDVHAGRVQVVADVAEQRLPTRGPPE